jgi:hypothetical protein
MASKFSTCIIVNFLKIRWMTAHEELVVIHFGNSAHGSILCAVWGLNQFHEPKCAQILSKRAHAAQIVLGFHDYLERSWVENGKRPAIVAPADDRCVFRAQEQVQLA